MTLSSATSIVLAACLAVLPLAPTPHVHEAEHHGVHEQVVHSHGTAHHHHHEAPDHLDSAIFDDVDSVVLTLDPVFALTDTFTLAAPSVDVAVELPEPPRAAAPVLPALVKPLAHSPPRAPAVLRGPPSLSRL